MQAASLATEALAAQFARDLTAVRTERHETQKQLAIRLGMTESMICRLESGVHMPSLTTLARIAGAFERRLQIAFHEHEHEHAGAVFAIAICTVRMISATGTSTREISDDGRRTVAAHWRRRSRRRAPYGRT